MTVVRNWLGRNISVKDVIYEKRNHFDNDIISSRIGKSHDSEIIHITLCFGDYFLLKGPFFVHGVCVKNVDKEGGLV